MRKTMVDVPAQDGTADAYLVRPDGEGPYAGVLMFQDGFGLRPRLEEMADRIAERGYAVLVPNLFYRSGRAPLFDTSRLREPEQREKTIQQVMKLAGGLTPAAIVGDTEAYLDFLAAQDGVDPGPVVITGYCMGAMNALRAIEAYPGRIAGAACFHGGRLVTDQPDSPHLRVGEITGEVYLGHADEDPSMTREQIATLETALDAAGVTYRSEVYDGAPHGYTMSDTSTYDEDGERRHWTNLFELLDRVQAKRR
ncbi:dienelactone hydrolase family protein [Actinomadura sp. DC4]|uniref:dienelactone hydrolase family protein n=1 Tax=Actinomadura sp. DC4 TaxID=3055069 RepID=UPI0025B1933F|nr:dienelactone hydrolase family protein [Actinomadura sp. DC4]MDN3352196.1 dienelactone hydrolase family protein [Actinomadura sp. DC4]